MDPSIHPSAVVHPAARLAEGVCVGAFTIIDEHVEVGAGTRIGHHCVLTGKLRIGRDNRIFHFVSLGEALEYAGRMSWFREEMDLRGRFVLGDPDAYYLSVKKAWRVAGISMRPCTNWPSGRGA